jgi:hypothetical protein
MHDAFFATLEEFENEFGLKIDAEKEFQECYSIASNTSMSNSRHHNFYFSPRKDSLESLFTSSLKWKSAE